MGAKNRGSEGKLWWRNVESGCGFWRSKKVDIPLGRASRAQGGLLTVGRLWSIEVLWYYKGMAYIRKFKTGSGKTGVQVCYKERGKVVRTVHVGSAETEQGIERLMKKAQGIMDDGKRALFDLDKF